MLSNFQKIIEKMAFPDDIKCIVCDDELPVKNRFSICNKCTLKPLMLFCDVCGRAFDAANSEDIKILKEEDNDNRAEKYNDSDSIIKPSTTCEKCLKNPPNFDIARSAFFYDGEIKNLIYKLKFGNARYLAKFLSEYMLDVLFNFIEMEEGDAPEVITFVPMYRTKQRLRGYNQAKLLAEELSKKSNIPIVDVLERIKDTKNVAKMTRAERENAIKKSITIKDSSQIKYKNILLIDDVFTTGTTANECAKVLKSSHANNVYVLTFATSHA